MSGSAVVRFRPFCFPSTTVRRREITGRLNHNIDSGLAIVRADFVYTPDGLTARPLNMTL